MKFEERIIQQEFKLNDTDDEIINYIRKHRSQLSSISIQTIAKELYIVPTAIMRLCKKLGYTGYAQLKVLLEDEEKQIMVAPTRCTQNVAKTVELIKQEVIQEVAAKLNTAKTVHFIGVGESLPYCQMMKDYMECYHRKAGAYTSYREIEYRMNHCDTKDILFVISATGRNEKINEWVKEASSKGTMVISITHFDTNPLAQIADIPLYFYGEEKKVNGYDISDRIGIMLVAREVLEEFSQMYCV